MKPYITTVAIDLDARRDLLIHIRTINPGFFDLLYNKHLKDKLVYSDFDKALLEALASFGITFLINDLTIFLEYKTNAGFELLDKFDDYDSALQFAIALLKVRK